MNNTPDYMREQMDDMTGYCGPINPDLTNDSTENLKLTLCQKVTKELH